MHVLFLNQYALPAGSAGITRHGDIGAELVKRGHDVTVIASDYDYLNRRAHERRHRSEITDDGVRFIWLRTGSYTGNDRSRIRSMLSYSWKALVQATRLHRRPDVIVASSPHPLAWISGLAAARWLRVPLIVEARDFWPSALVDLGAVRPGSPTHRALLLVERGAYRWSTRVVVVPPRGHLRLRELGLDAGKAIHIPNGTRLVPREPLPASLEHILGQLYGTFVIAYTGALGVPQRFESVLDGMALVDRDHPDESKRLALLLVGGGVRRSALMERAAEARLGNVFFHEPIGKGAIGSLLARSDAGLVQLGALDNLKYGLSPNKLYDYMGAGKPVLIAAQYPSVVEEAQAGIRFPPGDPGAFADAVVTMMRMPPTDRVEMGARGRELVRTRYSIATITDTYERLLLDLIATRR